MPVESTDHISAFNLAAAQKTGKTKPPVPFSAVQDFSRFIPDTTSHGASGSWQPSLTERATEFGKSLLPSPRTAARIIGGTVGGLAGPEGVLPGVMIGESAYQLGQHLVDSPEAPRSATEAAAGQSGAAIEGALQAGIPWAAQYHAEHPILPALRRTLFRSPQTLVTRGLTPSDNFFQQHVDNGLSELKTGQDRILNSDNPAQTSRDVLKQRRQGYSAQIDNKIVKPQASIKVPGSGDALAKAQIEQIPEDIRLHDPDNYARLVAKTHETAGKDLTIGELNSLRSELAGTQSLYYGKDTSGQLTMDSGTRAIDIARGNAARRLFYSSLDNYGLGGGKAAAAINGRIGSIIHMDDALIPKINDVVAQKAPLGQRVLNAASRIAAPSKWGTSNRTVAQDLNLAIRRWNKTPDPIRFSLDKRVRGTTGQQSDLLPIGDVDREPLLAPPPGTATGIGQSIFRVQQRANQAARTAPPPTLTGAQQGLHGFPGPLGETRFGPQGEYLTPEMEYLQQLHQRESWQAGAPVPPPTGQLEMFPGGPPNLFPPTEHYPSSTPASPDAAQLQARGSIGTRGARILASSEPPPKPTPPTRSAKTKPQTFTEALEEQGRIGTHGAEKIRNAEEYLRKKAGKPKP